MVMADNHLPSSHDRDRLAFYDADETTYKGKTNVWQVKEN